MRLRLKMDLITIVVALGVFVLLALLFEPFVGIIMGLCMGLVFLSQFLAYRSSRNTLRLGGPLPGVYANGVELPIYPIYATQLFIPWTEMEDAWVKRSRVLDDVLFIAVRESRWRWRVPSRLFGQEGMQAVIERARDPRTLDIPEPEQPAPKLVIYSAEGAKTESVPEEG
ncbi:MAG: hypothetical protein JSW25_09725 [Thermoplasmata archaeon]|nr:MAG: hypothetical protein JSW25_09725 [Thermoplasmata archaeon]